MSNSQWVSQLPIKFLTEPVACVVYKSSSDGINITTKFPALKMVTKKCYVYVVLCYATLCLCCVVLCLCCVVLCYAMLCLCCVV